MTSFIAESVRTFLAGATLAEGLRVVQSGGSITAAGATTVEYGTTEERIVSGDYGPVRLRTAEGTIRMIASEAISADGEVYAAASGKVAASGTIFIGWALTAASADGDVIEVLRGRLPDAKVAAVAATGSVQGDAAALTVRALNSVSAADGTKGVILPSAAAGLKVEVYNEHATNGLKIYPASGDTINGGSANAAITMEGKGIATFSCYDGTNWAAAFIVNT